MVTKVFAVLDVKVSGYGTPFFCSSNGLAIRMFSDLAKDPKTTLYAHPEDFQLFYIAEFDNFTGSFTQSSKPELLATAAEFKSSS